MKKEFQTPEEAVEFIRDMPDREKYAFDFYRDKNGTVVLQWIEYKQYTAHDGKVFPDEIWITEDNEMHCIQDLEPEHCRNIIRMMLRNTRESQQRLRELVETTLYEIGNMDMDPEEPEADEDQPSRLLH